MKFFENYYWYPYKRHGFSSNIYAIDQGKEIWLIDIGANTFHFFKSFIKRFKEDSLEIKNITRLYITHSHPDHLSAYKKLRKLCNCKLYLTSKQYDLVKESNLGFWNAQRNAAGVLLNEITNVPYKILIFGTSIMMGKIPKIHDYEIIQGNEIIGNKISFNIIPTPGHSPDHYSLYDAESKILIAGDIFGRKIGKAVFNLPTANFSEYYDSIEILKKIHPKIWVTGHGTKVFGDDEDFGELCRLTIENLLIIKKITIELLKSNGDRGLLISEIKKPYPNEIYDAIEHKPISFCVLNYLIKMGIAMRNNNTFKLISNKMK
jgi:glyoxylase-like metal-dependent hydrolase (beta-lactamase superfamily II)